MATAKATVGTWHECKRRKCEVDVFFSSELICPCCGNKAAAPTKKARQAAAAQSTRVLSDAEKRQRELWKKRSREERMIRQYLHRQGKL